MVQGGCIWRGGCKRACRATGVGGIRQQSVPSARTTACCPAGGGGPLMLAVFAIPAADRVSGETGGFTYRGTSSLPVLTACLAVFFSSLPPTAALPCRTLQCSGSRADLRCSAAAAAAAARDSSPQLLQLLSSSQNGCTGSCCSQTLSNCQASSHCISWLHHTQLSLQSQLQCLGAAAATASPTRVHSTHSRRTSSCCSQALS
jgi:hypothetical protein